VRVEGLVETRRGRRLGGGERVLIDGRELVVPSQLREAGSESPGEGTIAP
jgi:ribosome-associated protein YbcJ (S4-like RNA binding protein)